MIRAAVIGAGYVGSFHAEKYAELPGVELVAVVDTSPERARRLAERLETRAETEFRSLLGRIDCASVATPTALHFPIARELLAAGVDVLVEKPLARTVPEARELVELARRERRILQVGHLERFNPAVQALLALADSPRFVESQRLVPFAERGTDVDVVRDLMIHDLDVVLACVPREVERIEAVGVPVLTGSVDIANVRLRFAGGSIAQLTASRVSSKRERRIRLFQADTYVSVDYDARSVRIVRRRRTGDGFVIESEESGFGEADTLRSEIESFVRAVRERTEPVIGGEAGLRALALAERINACMETA
ncbi:MAG: UDP-N-acetylglucosamine 3-dehydrogenase [Candidatus Binatia bacterium]|nr:MAG: UDP-N-acetylglucosamine 3-dehydrogenase [Candidatus Binatia bacterium]